MAEIILKNIVKEYGDGFQAVKGVSLDVRDGEFMILVGPSGCGKSTVLRMIVGLEDITTGDLLIDGQRVNGKAPRDRNLAMVFQNYALYPHLTVYENIAFPLRLQRGRHSAPQIDAKVRHAAGLLELDEHLDRKPANLSGGQRQRVAMGRALVRDADAFLFDEPLSNLDAKLRGQMRTEIARIQRRLGTTTVYVTHDQTEAMTLGDRVAVLRKGELQQCASPRELYEQPVNLFVAGFIGSPPMNFLPGRIELDVLHLPIGDVPLPESHRVAAQGKELVIAGIRPEHFSDTSLLDGGRRADQVVSDTSLLDGGRRADQVVSDTSLSDTSLLDGGRLADQVVVEVDVDVTEWLGHELYAYVPYEPDAAVRAKLEELDRDLDGEGMRSQLVVTLDATSRVRDGDRAGLAFDPRRMHLFDPESGVTLTRDEHAAARLDRENEDLRRQSLERARKAAAGSAAPHPTPL